MAATQNKPNFFCELFLYRLTRTLISISDIVHGFQTQNVRKLTSDRSLDSIASYNVHNILHRLYRVAYSF